MMTSDVNWQLTNDRRSRYVRESRTWRRMQEAAPDERLGTVIESRSVRMR